MSAGGGAAYASVPMKTPLTILTGASRGLGLAMAEQLLAAGHRVLAISRKAPPIGVRIQRLYLPKERSR